MAAVASRGRFVPASVVILAGFALWSVVSAAPAAFTDSVDLRAIWVAAHDFWLHRDPYALFLNYKLHGGGDPGYAPNYIPSFFLLLRPFFALGWSFFCAAFYVANLFLAVATVVLLCRLFLPPLPRMDIAALVFLFLAAAPLHGLLQKGQVTVLVLFCFLLAYRFQQKQNHLLATLFLFAALLKYNVTLPLMLVFLRRDMIAAPIAAALAHGLVIVAAAIWLGESPSVLVGNMVQVNDYLLYSGHVNFSNILSTFGATGGKAGVVLSAAISLLALALMALRRPSDDLLSLSLLSVVSLLAVYHGSYDMVMLIVPMAYVVRHVAPGSIGATWALKSSLIAISVSTFLLWYVLEFVDTLGVSSLDGHGFSGPHVIFLWYVLMIALAVSLVMLFAVALKDRGQPPQDLAISPAA